jgi:ankyrin repeat protein
MTSFGLGKTNSVVDSHSALQREQTVDPSTPFLAASEGNLALMQASLQMLQQPLTVQDDNHYTLLHAAASYGQVAVVRFLLQPQHNLPLSFINATDHDGDTALHYATNVETAKLLVQDGKINTSQSNANGKTALQAKQEELDELLQDEEQDEDDEEVETLKQLIEYLSTLTVM